MDGFSRNKVFLLVAVLLIALLAGQAFADSILPPGGGGDTGRVIGDAGFAYLSGLRTAVAAMLWNRLEPQLHTYYLGVGLPDQTYVLPTISIVLALDPQFEQAYYIGSWIIARRDQVEDGLELARLGAENNPESAILRASYAQMLAVFAKDYEAAAEQADIALGLTWESDIDKHNWYGVLSSVYRQAGRMDMVDMLAHELEKLDVLLEGQLGADEHDHDGDGHSDH